MSLGLLTIWRNYRAQQKNRSLVKLGDTLKNQVTTKEQRWEAIEALADCGDFSLAAPQLMKRFELVVEHGIVDKREKDRVVEILLQNAEISIPFVREAVRTQRRISWPIKVAEKLLSKEHYVELLLASLHTEPVLFDESLNERNIELLLALREISSSLVVEKARALLYSRDELVRVAALECIEAQACDNDEARQCLRDLLAEPPSDDNSRFIGLVKVILERHSWSVTGPK